MKRDTTKNMGLTRDMDMFTVITKRHSLKNKVSKREIDIDMPMVITRIVANSTKEKHVTKNAILKGEIMIVIMKIIANAREERDALKKDVIVKRHGTKNMCSRGMAKILKDGILKRDAMKNVEGRSRRMR